MVRFMSNGIVYETCPDNVAKLGLEFELNCKLENVFRHPETQREKKVVARAIKYVEDEFDAWGHAKVKIIYVDVSGDGCKEEDAKNNKHVDTLMKLEKKKAITEGRREQRLIFVKQDRDYWPDALEIGGAAVKARRAAKQKAYDTRAPGHELKPDRKWIFVPPLSDQEEKEPLLAYQDAVHRDFMRYFDPSLPRTRFIIENIHGCPELETSFEECINQFPDLRKIWMSSSLASLKSVEPDCDWELIDFEGLRLS